MSLNHNESYNREVRQWIEKNIEYTKYLASQNLIQRDCPVCSSKKYSFFVNNDYLDYTKCDNCSLVFMNPTIDESSIQDGFRGGDELLMSYFKLMQKYKRFDTVSDNKPDPKKDNKLQDIYQFKQNGRLLDIGCSVGDFLHKAKYFYDVEGVEVNPNTSAYAKEYFTVHTDYLNNLNLTKQYDIVTLHQILYGVPDVVFLLKDIYKILNDDGILYINTPNANSYAMKLFQGKTNHLYGYTSQNIFNRQSLEYLAKLSGFKIKLFRTEWLDIYNLDIQEFYTNPSKFIHKRNISLKDYSKSLKLEDEVQSNLNTDLKDGGNYMVAILEKA
jgi:SAM-dependent methyltransferase